MDCQRPKPEVERPEPEVARLMTSLMTSENCFSIGIIYLLSPASSEALRFAQYDSHNNVDDSHANGAASHKQAVMLCNMFLLL